MDLDALTDELYALPREDFTAARDATAKAARAAGHRDVAAAMKKLAKPSAAAWLANRLARERPDEVRSLLALGDALRAATAARDGAELRRLAPMQNSLVADLVTLARRIGETAGARVTEDTARGLDETLRAALADSDLGAELVAGRTTDVLRFSGFPDVGFVPAPPRAAGPQVASNGTEPETPDEGGAAPQPDHEPAPSRADRDRAARLARADAAVAEAQAVADDAAAAARAARADLDAAGAAKADATEDVRRLRAELEAALAHRQTTERGEVDARKVSDKTQSVARSAADRLAKALAERRELDAPPPRGR